MGCLLLLLLAKSSLVRALLKSHSIAATSCWLNDALKAALKRDPLDVAKHAGEQAAFALAYIVVQRAQMYYFYLI